MGAGVGSTIPWTAVVGIVVSLSALGFTVFAFWWMNWRSGAIRVGPPRSYATKGTQSAALIIQLPLVFFNDGTAAIVIQNLRLVFRGEPTRPLRFMATVDEFAKSDGRQRARQFPVKGREAVALLCEFQRRPGELLYSKGRYWLELQARLYSGPIWRRLLVFALSVAEEDLPVINEAFSAHDNDAD